jgi:hypothetical protein
VWQAVIVWILNVPPKVWVLKVPKVALLKGGRAFRRIFPVGGLLVRGARP